MNKKIQFFLLLSLILISCTAEEPQDITLGQFTEIQFQQADQKLIFQYILDNSNSHITADLYINLQNPALFTALKFSISQDGKEIASGDSTQNTKRDTQTITHSTCDQKCTYQAEFSLTDKDKFVASPISFFQFLSYDGETEENKDKTSEYPVYGPIQIQTKHLYLDSISQNLLVDANNENGIQTKKFCFLGNFSKFTFPKLDSKLFFSVAQNSLGEDFQVAIAVENINDKDINNVQKWPKFDAIFSKDQFTYRQRNNAFFLTDINVIQIDYFAVSVYVKYDPSKVKNGSFLISLQALYDSYIGFQYKTDLSINRVVRGQLVQKSTSKVADIGYATLSPERSSLYYQVYSMYEENQRFQRLQYLNDYTVNQTDLKSVDPLGQFVYLDSTVKYYYYVFYPEEQDQTIQNHAGSGDQYVQRLSSYNLKQNVDSNLLFTMTIDADKYSYKNEDLQIRIKVSDDIKQDKLQVQYQIIDTKYLPSTLKDSKIYDLLPQYITKDGSRVLDLSTFPETGTHFLVVKFVKNQEIDNNSFIALTSQMGNNKSNFLTGEQKEVYINQHFINDVKEFQTNKDELTALGTDFILTSYYSNNNLQFGMSINAEENQQNTDVEFISENSSDDSNIDSGRYYSFKKYTKEEIAQQCPNKCTIKIEFSSKTQLTSSETMYYKFNFFTQKQETQTVWGSFVLPTPDSQAIQFQIMQKTNKPIQVYQYQVNARYGEHVIVSVNTNNPNNKNQFHLVKATPSQSNNDIYPTLSENELQKIWSETPITYNDMLPLDICKEENGCKQLVSLYINYKDSVDMNYFYILGQQRKSALTIHSYQTFQLAFVPNLFPSFFFNRIQVSTSKLSKNQSIDISYSEAYGQQSTVYLFSNDDQTKELVPLGAQDQLDRGADWYLQYPSMSYYAMYMMNPLNTQNKITLEISAPSSNLRSWEFGNSYLQIFSHTDRTSHQYFQRNKDVKKVSLVYKNNSDSKDIKVQYRSLDQIKQNTQYPPVNGKENVQSFKDGVVVYDLDGEGPEILFTFTNDSDIETTHIVSKYVRLIEGVYDPQGDDDDDGLGTGWIILIVIGVLIVIGGIVFIVIKKRKQNQQKDTVSNYYKFDAQGNQIQD